MSYVKIILHCVWSTKERKPQLADRDRREALFAHICTNGKEKGLFILQVGGYVDHLHLMLLLGKNQEVAKVLQMIKGEASHWYNSEYRYRLEWQDDYFAVSVSESHLSRVSKYILNQEEHHRHKTFEEEYQEFMRCYKWSKS